jgi:YVTN family beta-propeller protein
VKVGPRPRSVAFTPDGAKAYVPSENGASLTAIDVGKLAPSKTIDLGKGMRPMGTHMSADGKLLYVSTGRSKMALVLDTSTDKVVASVEAGDRPWGIGLAPDEKTLYTANGPSDDVSVIDLASRMVIKKIPVGHGPWGLAVIQAP